MRRWPEAVRRHLWISHNILENLVHVGTTKAGNQVQVDTGFCNADVKLTLSGPKRHFTSTSAGRTLGSRRAVATTLKRGPVISVHAVPTGAGSWRPGPAAGGIQYAMATHDIPPDA